MKEYDPDALSWSLMTKTSKGVVSIVRGLTEREAAKAYFRLDPFYGQHEVVLAVHPDLQEDVGCVQASVGCDSVFTHGDWIEIKEVFGPPGWESFSEELRENWPKYTKVWTDPNGEILDDERQDHPEAARGERARRQVERSRQKPPQYSALSESDKASVRKGFKLW